MTSDLVGWIAAAATLLTFSMRSMVGLRIAALVANVCFVAYGWLSGLYPIVALHILLIPCNIYRLSEVLRSDGVNNAGSTIAIFARADKGRGNIRR
jgi:hypothetical protein